MPDLPTANSTRLDSVLSKVTPIVVASHPRSGTHLTIDFLRKNFLGCQASKRPLEPLNYLYVSLDGLAEPNRLFDEDYAVTVLSRCDYPIVKTHSLSPECANVSFYGGEVRSLPRALHRSLFAAAKVIYVYRDCRKVMPSLQQWMQGFNPQARVPIDAFIQQCPQGDKSRIQQWVEHVTQWTGHPEVVSIRYEDLISRTNQVAEKLQRELDLEVAGEIKLPRKYSVFRARLARLFGRRAESTAILGRHRAKRQFDLAPQAEEMIAEEAGPLMRQLGYSI